MIATILILEAAALTLFAVLFVGTIFGASPVSVGGSAFMAVLLLLVAAALITMARKLASGYRWPRSPSLVVQIFLMILAFPYFSTGTPLIGALLMVPAAAVVVTLFSKPVVDFTVRTTGDQKAL